MIFINSQSFIRHFARLLQTNIMTSSQLVEHCTGIVEVMLFIHGSRLFYEPAKWPAPSWLVSSVGRALHRYRRGHGFKSRTHLNLCQASLSLLLMWCSLLRRSLSFKTIVTIRKICESVVVITGYCKYDPTNSLCSSLKHAELLMGNLASEQLHLSTSSDAKHDILQA